MLFKKNLILSMLCLLLFYCDNDQAFKTIKFKAVDGVKITADLYMSYKKNATFIVLFHQGGSSRGEYREIAPKLNELGFNCLAIDQRSGSYYCGVENETGISASKLNKSKNFIDAKIDMTSAVEYAKKKYAKGKIIIWDSSYSASLVLYLSGTKQINADGMLSFSPGEYFSNKSFIRTAASNIIKPVFITSALSEKYSWRDIYEAIPSQDNFSFLPENGFGKHGSSTLREKNKGNEEYWIAVEGFL